MHRGEGRNFVQGSDVFNYENNIWRSELCRTAFVQVLGHVSRTVTCNECIESYDKAEDSDLFYKLRC